MELPTVLGIDPGTRSSGVVVIDLGSCRVLEAYKAMDNDDVLSRIYQGGWHVVACEWIEHYGANIHAGADVFHTCRWIGRFEEAAHGSLVTITRRQVKLHLCGNMRAKDPHVRKSIVDRFGGEQAAKGNKKNPGPLFGVSSHAWSALAVALTYLDQR